MATSSKFAVNSERTAAPRWQIPIAWRNRSSRTVDRSPGGPYSLQFNRQRPVRSVSLAVKGADLGPRKQRHPQRIRSDSIKNKSNRIINRYPDVHSLGLSRPHPTHPQNTTRSVDQPRGAHLKLVVFFFLALWTKIGKGEEGGWDVFYSLDRLAMINMTSSRFFLLLIITFFGIKSSIYKKKNWKNKVYCLTIKIICIYRKRYRYNDDVD